MTYYLSQKVKTKFGIGEIVVLGDRQATIRIGNTERKTTYSVLDSLNSLETARRGVKTTNGHGATESEVDRYSNARRTLAGRPRRDRKEVL